jgi:hypothetical protein
MRHIFRDKCGIVKTYFNSYGEQFHKQPKENYIIEIISNNSTLKDHNVGNACPGLGQAHTCGGVKPVNGITSFPSDNVISNDMTDINLPRFSSTQKVHTLSFK